MLHDYLRYMMKRPIQSLYQTQTTIIQLKRIDKTPFPVLHTPIIHHR